MTDRTCQHCAHAYFVPNELRAFGCAAVGRCAVGGPTPEQGNSDVGACESCPKFSPRHGIVNHA